MRTRFLPDDDMEAVQRLVPKLEALDLGQSKLKLLLNLVRSLFERLIALLLMKRAALHNLADDGL